MGEVTLLSGSLETLLNTTGGKLIGIAGDYYLVESDCTARDGEPLCYSFFGHCGIGKLMGRSLITQDGEAIEGDCLEDIVVMGKVTFMMFSVHDEKRPVI